MKNPFRRKKSEQSYSIAELQTASKTREEIEANDLPIALYLNQRATFDVLAALNNGFSHFTAIQTTITSESSTEMAGKADLGVSNVFALLGVDFGGSRQIGQKRNKSSTEEIVHTPASLFARLRKELCGLQLVRTLSKSSDLKIVQPGDFVEFEATLRRSPLVDFLDSLSQLVPLMQLADTSTNHKITQDSQRRSSKAGKGQQKHDQLSDIESQIRLFRSIVTPKGSYDLIAEMTNMRVVLTAEPEYFIDPSMNDTIDGTFHVFGKATRIISDETDKISLLRKTALGMFGNEVQKLGSAMANLQNSEFPATVETEVGGPAMQVIPIAIFA